MPVLLSKRPQDANVEAQQELLIQEKEMKKYPAVQRREYRPAGITPHFLETIEDEPDYSDDEDLGATERARSALQRRAMEDEDLEVS